ncbi:MAG: hypothetical protein AMJ54_12565 [Deltaproteobacteria bacterium SG8_13]|nr:MAG: hypothetical protein AMJ54_12565 [Deltaproteobacteria bacterium SG8_13]
MIKWIDSWRSSRRDRRKAPGIKSFNEKQKTEEAFEYVDRGTRIVPVDRIVGSVGRYRDFDGTFSLKSHLPRERLDKIRQAMRTGRSLPPVDLYQIKDEYYVLDGNHRIAAAKQLGRTEITARIVECIPSKDTLENILYGERSGFYEKTGLPFSIELTEVGQYGYLLRQIADHQSHREQKAGKPVTFKEAAEDWYKTIYWPLASMIKNGGLHASFPKRTIADLYAYVSYHQWEQERPRVYGIGLSKYLMTNMEEFREKMSSQKKVDYPEMLREITVFVLMNVEAKHELRIAEKLFALEEVKEVHAVHGNVDIIAKVVLTRDLLSSDAEVIGQFVHAKIRQNQGVLSTQTLIPSHSEMKTPSSAD